MAESTTTFQPGDVVQLKSGGTLMTIKALYDNYGTPSAILYYSSEQRPVNSIEDIALITLKKAEVSQQSS